MPPSSTLLIILILLASLESSSALLLPGRPRPLLGLGRHPLAALGVALLLLPRRPAPEPRLGLAGLQALDLAAALKQVPDDGRVGGGGGSRSAAGRGGGGLEVEQLVPQVELLGVGREQALEEGAPLLAVAVGRAELERRELGQQRRVQVRRVAAVARVAEHLRRPLEQRPRPVRLVGRRVQEVRVVDPDVGGGEAVFLDDLFKEIVGFLLGG